jgi:hypothetical protein
VDDRFDSTNNTTVTTFADTVIDDRGSEIPMTLPIELDPEMTGSLVI